MILVQLMKILPAASHFKVYDENRPILEGSISQFDKSVIFKSVNDDISYQRMYSSFHVELLDKIDDIWEINIR